MRCVLGFDGGGTKTDCVLMDESGRILAHSRSGPSNPFRVGIEASSRALQDAAQHALSEARAERSSIAALCAGLAGTSRPELAGPMRSRLAASFPGALIHVCTDLDLSLAAAGDGPAVVLIAGTGSAAIGRDEKGQVARAGMYGPQLADEGGAYDIGRRAIMAALRDRDRTGEDSSFGKQILRQLGYADWAEVQERTRLAPDEILPRAFPVVAAAADAGDMTARAILSDAANKLSALAATLVERLGLGDNAFILAKAGGTVGRSTFFDAQIDQRLRQLASGVRIEVLSIAPAETAARLALKLVSSAEVAGN
ncbi:MAG: hypothetical protein DMG43_08590 [Acidobacteria bacterium]|nr:MAG: hypothetical protein DMG43_08590 [Acidobacteriota bacterium]